MSLGNLHVHEESVCAETLANVTANQYSGIFLDCIAVFRLTYLLLRVLDNKGNLYN